MDSQLAVILMHYLLLTLFESPSFSNGVVNKAPKLVGNWPGGIADLESWLYDTLVDSQFCAQDKICKQNGSWGVNDQSKWKMDVVIESLPGGVPQAYNAAREKWMSLITGDLPAVSGSGITNQDDCAMPYPATIDDLHICAVDKEIDGLYGVLGSAGPTNKRVGAGTAVTGNMVFDIADIEWMVNDGIWEGVILHEMGQ